jgi:hypothetical protein
MNFKFGKLQALVMFLLVIMFGAASLIELGSSTVPLNPIVLKLRYLLVFAGLIGVFLLSIRDRKNWHSWKFNQEVNLLIGIWVLFCLIIEISGCINQDLTAIRDGYWLMICVPLFFFYAIPRLLKGTGNIVIPIALTISHLPFLLTSLILNPPIGADQTFYSGILGNSNQLGFVSAETTPGVLILLFASFYTRKSIILLGFLTFLLTLIMWILSLAYARTSIMAFLVMVLIFVSIYFLEQPKILFKIAFFGSFVISFLLLKLDKIIKYLTYDLGIDFFELFHKKEAGLSGREEIWSRTIHELTFLGHGSTYYDSFEHGPHNTVIKMLGVYGIVSMYFTIFLAIASFIVAHAYFKTHFKTNVYAITPLVITTCFWVLSLGEDMFGSLGKGITLAYFASMGVMMTEFSPQKSSQQLNIAPESKT